MEKDQPKDSDHKTPKTMISQWLAFWEEMYLFLRLQHNTEMNTELNNGILN